MASIGGQRRLRWWRPELISSIGLGLVVAARLAPSAPVLLFGHDRSDSLRVTHEMGSFEVAVALLTILANNCARISDLAYRFAPLAPN
jgi:hypothetical protein